MQNLLAVKGYRCTAASVWQHVHRQAVEDNQHPNDICCNATNTKSID
jgi:hypothetical protein